MEWLVSNGAMSRKVIVALAAIIVVAGLLVVQRAREWPALPNSPVALGELIEKSDLIVLARVTKVENPMAPVYASTNKWVRKAIALVGARDRVFATAHLEILQGIKGPAIDRVLVDYPVGFTKAPPVTTNVSAESVVVFLYRQRGAYHPVAYSYGTRVLGRKAGDELLRRVAEYVAMDKLSRREKERSRAEWFVKLMEDPATRWDGAASWIFGHEKDGEALKKLPADLAKRVEAVAFRDEPLADGDDVLLREFAPAHAKRVVRRVLRYFAAATKLDCKVAIEQPWRCSGAMELLIRIADMPAEYRERFANGPYPNLSDANARRSYVNVWLPEIETRLKSMGLVENQNDVRAFPN